MSQNEIQMTLLNTLKQLMQTVNEQQNTLEIQLKSYARLEKNFSLTQNNELTIWRKLTSSEQRIDELNNTVQTLLNCVHGLKDYETALNKKADFLKTLEQSVIELSQRLESSMSALADLLKKSD